MTTGTRHTAPRHMASSLAIVLVATCLGLFVEWRLPGLSSYTHDLLTRARGPLPVPDDIALVTIDEPSIARFGRFPWPRSVMARVIDTVSAGQPKAISVDILYTDPSVPAEDAALTAAIARAGNVVTAAQLVETGWLLPLDSIRRAAAGTGHVNVLTEADGAARHLLVATTDDAGTALHALAAETLRVGERLPPASMVDTGHALVIGPHTIPLDRVDTPVELRSPGHQLLRPGRMAIDYIGPTGSFAPVSFSAAAVLDGAVPASAFRGRWVLIGATAASIGERFPSPFLHHTDAKGNQHGTTMPGVEVLANALNTILRGRFYSPSSDLAAFLWALLAAGSALVVLAAFRGRHAAIQQTLALAILFGLLLAASYSVFHLFRVVPPLPAATVAFASAGLLGLLRRSFSISVRLDHGLADIAQASSLLAPGFAPEAAAEAIARLTGSQAAALFAATANGQLELVASHGAPVAARLNGGRSVTLPHRTQPPSAFFVLPAAQEQNSQIHIQPLADASGVFYVAHPAGKPPESESLRIAAVIAAAALQATAEHRRLATLSGLWPKGLEDKAQALALLNSGLVERSRFVNLALGSVEDGLIIAGPEGRIRFANRRAAEILDSTPEALSGRNLFDRLQECEQTSAAPALRELLSRLLLDRTPVEREIAIRGTRTRQYILRLSAVYSSPTGPVHGLVASISDITRQKELQQTKNDVISLVSHEMRTPLAAIQGMSELLAAYELDPAKRKEMNLAINDEVKRLTRMITEYLNITRLESGAAAPRLAPVRVEALLDRTLLLLEPVAAQRAIRLLRRVEEPVPAVLADPDLITRALENLISNAVKYSPSGRQVTVTIRAKDAHLFLDVADQGYGIPAADLGRIFEKFYRVNRMEDAGTPGTGLGLALVREIAELHGGSVTVQSEVGAGSTFTLTLPLEGR